MLMVYNTSIIGKLKRSFHAVTSFLKYLFICVKQNLVSNFANKASFILQAALMALNNITWLIVWIILFSKVGGNINGVTIKDILYLWSLPVITFGLTFLCFGGTEYLAQNISHGNLDVYLTQPKFSLIGLITSRSRLSALGDLIYGLILGLFATNFQIADYIFLLILAVISCVGLTSVLVIVHSLAFWLGDVTTMATTYTNSLFLTLTIYPDKMYNSFTKILIFTVVPTFYTTYLPISICTEFSILKLLLFFCTTTILATCAVLVYTRGLRKYESGNSFNLKY